MIGHTKKESVFDNLEQIGCGDSYQERVTDMMDRVEMFSDLSGAETKLIAPYVSAYKANKGVEVMSEGDNENYMFILVSGKLQVNKRDDDDVNKKLAIVRVGKSIGEMSVVDEQHHSATVVALEDSELLLVTKSNFDLMKAKRPEIGLKVLHKIANLMSMRLRQTSGLLVDYLDE